MRCDVSVMGHDYSLPGIESQNHRSRVGVRVNLLQWRIQKIVLGYLILPYCKPAGAVPPAGLQGQSPRWEVSGGGAKSPAAGVLMHSV